MNRIRLSVIALVAMTAVSPYAWSSTLVYQPNNPNFGGNPANGPNLLNEANAQNKHTDPSLSAFSSPTSTSSLDQFNAQLQQAILSRVAGSVTNSIVGTNGGFAGDDQHGQLHDRRECGRQRQPASDDHRQDDGCDLDVHRQQRPINRKRLSES